MQQEKHYTILLLTNRISDNLGDKTIEICDIALIQAAMKNLGITDFSINSQDATIIPKKYLQTSDESLLQSAREIIKNSSVIIFGGAPVFNYTYQIFAERTAVTIELAQQYGVPVLFSAIGIESYDSENEKCQKLKKTLNYEVVKQITTRDGYEYLENYKESEHLVIGKVSDPAVFASTVFEKFTVKDRERGKKKIGIFVLRANGFVDNKIDFSREDAAKLWTQLAFELKRRGYDFEFLTSGNFGDEAFLDLMTKKFGLNVKRCVFNMDTPEKMAYKISTYDAVISCRLHPSIVSFSQGVPALGIVWNSKVRHFYESIGYKDRLIEVKGITPEGVADCLEKAMSEGVDRDKDYLITVYTSLLRGIWDALCPNEESVKPYDYDELILNIPRYEGTSEEEKEDNYKRKFRRVYEKYNDLFEKNIENRNIINQLQANYVGYPIIYNGGTKTGKLSYDYDQAQGSINQLSTGSVEYRVENAGKNDGKTVLLKNHFQFPGNVFVGWRIRIKASQKWLWYMQDGTLKENPGKGIKRIFKDEETLPVMPVSSMELVVAEAVWKKYVKYTILYHCGAKPEAGAKEFRQMKHKYSRKDGEVKVLPSLAYELQSNQIIENGDDVRLLKNRYVYKNHVFVGWRMRIRVEEQWFWYLEDKTLCPKDSYQAQKGAAKIKIFENEEKVPYIPSDRIDAVVVEAVWKD